MIDPSLLSTNKRFWICCNCLINQSIQLFNPDTKEWMNAEVVDYSSQTKQHKVKVSSTFYNLHLNQYHIAIHSLSTTTTEKHQLLNQESISIDKETGIQKYCEEIQYHQQYQIVFD